MTLQFETLIGSNGAKNVFSRVLREVINKESAHYLRNDLQILLDMIEQDEIVFDSDEQKKYLNRIIEENEALEKCNTELSYELRHLKKEHEEQSSKSYDDARYINDLEAKVDRLEAELFSEN